MEHNRNLSSVIKSIRDEGPSSSVKEGATGGSEPVTPGKRTGHSVSWILFIFLLAGLAAAGIFLFVIGGNNGYFSAVLPETSTTSVADTQTVDIQLQTIRETQIQLGNRIDHLAATVIEISSIVNQWHGQQAVQDDVQLERQERISEALPAAPDQQDSLSSRNNEVIEVPITEADDLPVPRDEAGAAAVTSPDAVATPIQAGEAAITEPDPAADPQPDVNATVKDPATRQSSGEQEWVINVAYFGKQEPVQKLMAKLGQAGITSEQQQVTIDGKTGYRLRIPGFSTRLEASEYAKKNIGDDLGLKDPWVSRR